MESFADYYDNSSRHHVALMRTEMESFADYYDNSSRHHVALMRTEMESFADYYERTGIDSSPQGCGMIMTAYWPACLDLLTSLRDGTTLFGVSWAAVILPFGAS